MLKRITSSLLFTGISFSAMAGMPGNNVIVPVGVDLIAPDSSGTWIAGIEGLYMQPQQTFQYATVASGIAPNVTYQNASVSPGLNWGGAVDVAYIFPGHSRDVRVSYTLLTMNGIDSVASSGNVFLSNVVLLPGIMDAPDLALDAAKSKSEQDLHQIDLTFGQYFRIGNRVDIHPFGGLRYVQLDMFNTFHGDGSFGGPVEIDNVIYGNIKNEFNGVGPRVGVDGAVHLGYGLSIVGTLGSALLVGNNDNFNEHISGTLIDGNVISYQGDSHVSAIPELDARLGLDYLYTVNPGFGVHVQAGYQVVDFFNAFNVDVADVEHKNSINMSSDFAYQGLYLRLQIDVT